MVKSPLTNVLLVHIVGGIPQELGTLVQFLDLQLDNVAVNAHLPNIGAHVVNAHQRHPLLNQAPFLVRNLEIDAAAFAFGAFRRWRRPP